MPKKPERKGYGIYLKLWTDLDCREPRTPDRWELHTCLCLFWPNGPSMIWHDIKTEINEEQAHDAMKELQLKQYSRVDFKDGPLPFSIVEYGDAALQRIHQYKEKERKEREDAHNRRQAQNEDQ